MAAQGRHQVVEHEGGAVAGEVIAIGIEQPPITQARAAAGARRAERVKGVVEHQMGVAGHKGLQLTLQIGVQAIMVAAIEAGAALLGRMGRNHWGWQSSMGTPPPNSGVGSSSTIGVPRLAAAI